VNLVKQKEFIMVYMALIVGLFFMAMPSQAQSRRSFPEPLFNPTQILRLEGGNLNKNQVLLPDEATPAQQRVAIVRTSTRFVDHRGQWRYLKLQFFRHAPQANTWIMRAEVIGAEFTEISLVDKTQTGDDLRGNDEVNRAFQAFYPVVDSQVVLFFNNKAQLAGIMDVNGDILHQGIALIQILYQDKIEDEEENLQGSFILHMGDLNSVSSTISQFSGFIRPSFRQDGYTMRV
jgi:hypothetical protein